MVSPSFPTWRCNPNAEIHCSGGHQAAEFDYFAVHGRYLAVDDRSQTHSRVRICAACLLHPVLRPWAGAGPSWFLQSGHRRPNGFSGHRYLGFGRRWRTSVLHRDQIDSGDFELQRGHLLNLLRSFSANGPFRLLPVWGTAIPGDFAGHRPIVLHLPLYPLEPLWFRPEPLWPSVHKTQLPDLLPNYSRRLASRSSQIIVASSRDVLAVLPRSLYKTMMSGCVSGESQRSRVVDVHKWREQLTHWRGA